MPYACPINGKGANLNINTNSISSSPSSPSSIPQIHVDSVLKTSSIKNNDLSTKKQRRNFFIYDEEDVSGHDLVRLKEISNAEKSNNGTPSKESLSPTSSQTPPSNLLKELEDEPSEYTPEPYHPEPKSPSPSKSLLRSNSSKHKLINAGGISKLSLNSSEILKFPKESTHAYSYAHLSPNSLAVRLSVLKRSLEILLDRPDLINSDKKGDSFNHPTSFNLDIENFISQIQNENDDLERPASPASSAAPNINIRSNASSAALAALFNNTSHSAANSRVDPRSSSSALPKDSNLPKLDASTSLGLKALINILQEDKLHNNSATTKKSLAQNLHDLSLSSGLNGRVIQNKKNLDSEAQLKIKLLYALATPFYESIAQTPIISLNRGASTLALSSLNIPPSPVTPTSPSTNTSTNGANNNNNRIFHTVSQRNTSPQAVFTCELNNPWDLKAANDLACLVFGVSRNSLRRLTLLDLISPDSRDFVLNRLISSSLTKSEIIFSGEVIAIAKSGNKLTWASLWAKKKGNLIICMFDQVPCDSVDLILNLDSLVIESHKKVSGTTFFNDVKDLQNADALITSFGDFLTKNRELIDSNIPRTISDSQNINQQRYFTLKKSTFNVPCAITSKVIDENESKIKLKIHTLPYIAGVFIISSSDYSLLSFNQSISKNLFGYNESQLLNKSIDKIIPNFIKIIKFVLSNFQNLKFIPGLVLPEHFFRQINSLVENEKEDGFLNSIGLDGKHADGSTIKVDIQLRCSNDDTLVLWITYSRNVYGDKLDPGSRNADKSLALTKSPDHSPTSTSSASSSPSASRTVSHSDSSKSQQHYEEDGPELPSQLSILDEQEIQSVSRSSSMRSSDVADNTSKSSGLPTVPSSKQNSLTDVRSMIPSQINSENTESVNVEHYEILDKTMNEDKLLKIENETIERTKSMSRYYPKVIGLKRREKSIKEFKTLKKMGQGAYGRVILAENINDPNYRVVIKLIIKERILVDTWVRDRKLGTIPSEIQIMATLNNNPHPNIMRLIDFFEDDNYYYIETPRHGFPTPAIDLFDMIELKKSMSEHECKSIMKQCISAINHLHNNGVVHRDIKDENLIIDSKGIIKLIDFGSAAYIKQGPFDVFVGTLDYAAPEVLNGKPYEGKPQDVWSLGILIYTLIYKENPFYNVDEIMEGELRIPFVTSEGCINLIKKILQRDIRKRPTMKDLLEDSWINEV